MNFPQNITGPQFQSGDIVSFTFKDCVLSLRLPVVPHNTDKIDKVSQQKNFDWGETDDWEHYGDEGNAYTSIVTQGWRYECDVTHDDIASCYMNIYLLKHSPREIEGLFSLNTESFKSYHLAEISEAMREFEEGVDIPPEKPSASNNYLVKTVSKPVLDGFQIQQNLSDATPIPSISAYFSLGREFTLRVEWDFGSIHYRDRKNPYSEELLHNMKFELFDEFLSLIDIDYSEDTLALIEKQK